jgi:hypothetical protein
MVQGHNIAVTQSSAAWIGSIVTPIMAAVSGDGVPPRRKLHDFLRWIGLYLRAELGREIDLFITTQTFSDPAEAAGPLESDMNAAQITLSRICSRPSRMRRSRQPSFSIIAKLQ